MGRLVSNPGESMSHAGCGNPTHSVRCRRRSMAITIIGATDHDLTTWLSVSHLLNCQLESTIQLSHP